MTSFASNGMIQPVIDPMATPGTIRRPRRPLAQTAFGTDQTQINPLDDLRSKQITPGYDPRLAATQGQTDTARNTLASTAFSDYVPVNSAGSQYTANADRLRGQAEGALGTGVVANTDPSRAQSFLNQAATSYGAAPAGVGGVGYSGDTSGVRSQYVNSLGNLQGPNRSDLASKAFALLQEQNAPGRQLERQNVGRQAAALGRIGAGMTTNDLTGLEGTYAREDDQAMRGLAGDAASRELEDRLGISGALGSATGLLSGEDRALGSLNMDAAARNASLGGQRGDAFRALSGDQLNLDRLARDEGESDRAYGLQRSGAYSGLADDAFGQGQSLRNEDRAEGNRRLGYDESTLARNRGIFGDFGAEENRLQDSGRRYRDEFRGERDYQTDAAQRGIDNARTQRLDEEDLLNSGFDREYRRTGLYNDLGYGGANQLGGVLGDQAAGQEQRSADAFGGVGDVLSEFLANRALAPKRKRPASSTIGNTTVSYGEN